MAGGGPRLLTEGRGLRRGGRPGLRPSLDPPLWVSAPDLCCLTPNPELSGNLGLELTMAVGSELSEREPGSGGFLERFPKNSICPGFLGRALASGCENLRGCSWPSGLVNLGSRLTSGSEDVLGRLPSSGWEGFLESALNSDCLGLLGNTQTSGSEDVLVRSPNSDCRGFLGRSFG